MVKCLKNIALIYIIMHTYAYSTLACCEDSLIIDQSILIVDSPKKISKFYDTTMVIYVNGRTIEESKFIKGDLMKKIIYSYRSDSVVVKQLISYYSNGKIEYMYYFVGSCEIGNYFRWYENGQLAEFGTNKLTINLESNVRSRNIPVFKDDPVKLIIDSIYTNNTVIGTHYTARRYIQQKFVYAWHENGMKSQEILCDTTKDKINIYQYSSNGILVALKTYKYGQLILEPEEVRLICDELKDVKLINNDYCEYYREIKLQCECKCFLGWYLEGESRFYNDKGKIIKIIDYHEGAIVLEKYLD